MLGWSGMRGIVSLAAALALPLDFPQRDAIVFVAFVVIFVTLVGQGLSLIPLLRWLRISQDDAGDGERRELEVRVAALEAGLAAIARLERDQHGPEQREVLARLRDEYENRIAHLSHHAAPGATAETAESAFDHAAQRAAVSAERRAIRALRDRGRIPDEIFRKVQYDLDLAETRLF